MQAAMPSSGFSEEGPHTCNNQHIKDLPQSSNQCDPSSKVEGLELQVLDTSGQLATSRGLEYHEPSADNMKQSAIGQTAVEGRGYAHWEGTCRCEGTRDSSLYFVFPFLVSLI